MFGFLFHCLFPNSLPDSQYRTYFVIVVGSARWSGSTLFTSVERVRRLLVRGSLTLLARQYLSFQPVLDFNIIMEAISLNSHAHTGLSRLGKLRFAILLAIWRMFAACS